MDSSFTETEKRFLLAEMVKASQIDLHAFVDFAKGHHIQPDWLAMQVPNGRNMHQCIRAAQNMGLMHLQPPAVPITKRKSISELDEPLPKRQALGPPIEPQPTMYASRNVNIQPRPSSNGYVQSPIITTIGPPIPPSRKRGRPSKADKEAAARASAPSSFGQSTPPLLAPHPGPSHSGAIPGPGPSPIAPREYSPSPFSSYHATPGPPVEPNSKKRATPVPADRAEPRALPDLILQQDEKPALSHSKSATDLPTLAPLPSISQMSPAVQEASRKLHPPLPPPPQVDQPAMRSMQQQLKESHTPVNTKA